MTGFKLSNNVRGTLSSVPTVVTLATKQVLVKRKCSLVAYPDPRTKREPYRVGFGRSIKYFDPNVVVDRAEEKAWLRATLERLYFELDNLGKLTGVPSEDTSALVTRFFRYY